MDETVITPAADDVVALSLTDRAVQLVQAMAQGEIDRLDPVLDATSPNAYSYPRAVDVLQVEAGAEVPVLNALTDKGVLSSERVGEVDVCPFCRSYALRVEKCCPACGGRDMQRTTMIHHFRCGNVSPEESYQRGHDLVCPKCDRRLKHIGVDYERPSEAWQCGDCGKLSASPELRYQSVTCGRRFPIDDAVERAVYTYVLSGDGKTLAGEGVVRSALEEPSAFDALTGLPGAGAVLQALDVERRRAQRYDRPSTVAHVLLGNGPELMSSYGEEAVGRVLRVMATIAKQRLRAVDFIGRDSTFGLTCILPETDIGGAEIVADKLRHAADEYLHAPERDKASRDAEIRVECEPVSPESEEG